MFLHSHDLGHESGNFFGVKVSLAVWLVYYLNKIIIIYRTCICSYISIRLDDTMVFVKIFCLLEIFIALLIVLL